MSSREFWKPGCTWTRSGWNGTRGIPQAGRGLPSKKSTQRIKTAARTPMIHQTPLADFRGALVSDILHLLPFRGIGGFAARTGYSRAMHDGKPSVAQLATQLSMNAKGCEVGFVNPAM
jgi:hypothetical protein